MEGELNEYSTGVFRKLSFLVLFQLFICKIQFQWISYILIIPLPRDFIVQIQTSFTLKILTHHFEF